MVNVFHISTSTNSKPNKFVGDAFNRQRLGSKEAEALELTERLKHKRHHHHHVSEYVWGKEGILQTVKNYFAEFPHKLRCMFAGAFLAHSYRPEWGNYIKWDPHLPTRTPKEVEIKLRRSSSKINKRSSLKQRKSKSKVKKVVKTVTDTPPKPLPHNHADCLLVRINVSGRIFEPQARTLNQFPHTLLGNPKRMMKYYDPERDEFFFDRHRTSFEAIISYYQTGGIIRKPHILTMDHFLEEVKFYDLGHEIIKYLESTESGNLDCIRCLPTNLLRRKLWLLFEYPESSYQSRIFAYLSVLAVTLSIVEFCIETIPTFCWQTDHVDSRGKSIATDRASVPFDLRDPFFLTETICVIFFIFEYVMRMLASPHWFQFVKSFSNIIDLISIVPYFINLTNDVSEDEPSGCGGTTSTKKHTDSLTIFKIIRLVRVFRILKLSRHNKGLKILGMTLQASIRELGLLVFFLMIGVVVFSSLMFFAEATSNEDTPFDSIPTGFWFSVVTMTTLGYGDLVPTTIAGKIVGALCAITGVLTISLPVPVIVSNFNMFYNREELNEVSKTHTAIDHVEQCPHYPGWYNADGEMIGSNLPPAGSVDQFDPACLQWLVGEQKPDYSDTDFEDLKKDELFKKVKREPIKKKTTRVRKTIRPSLLTDAENCLCHEHEQPEV